MTMQELKIFEEKQVRTVLDEVQEKGISALFILYRFLRKVRK